MPASYNIAPSQDIAVVRAGGGRRHMALLRWGLVPAWAKEVKSGYSMINARAETVADKPTYRTAFKHKRCLIPTTGFYEWKREGSAKVPYHIRMPGSEVFAFAGLWDRWERDGEGFDSCSIIVTAANPDIQPIHDRMPVIVNPAQYNSWLNPGQFNRPQLESLLVPFAGQLETFPVSRRVNSPANDDAGLIEPAS